MNFEDLRKQVDSDEEVIMWLNLVSDNMNLLELTDYAERYLVDRFSVLDGVARVDLITLCASGLTARLWLRGTLRSRI